MRSPPRHWRGCAPGGGPWRRRGGPPTRPAGSSSRPRSPGRAPPRRGRPRVRTGHPAVGNVVPSRPGRRGRRRWSPRSSTTCAGCEPLDRALVASRELWGAGPEDVARWLDRAAPALTHRAHAVARGLEEVHASARERAGGRRRAMDPRTRPRSGDRRPAGWAHRPARPGGPRRGRGSAGSVGAASSSGWPRPRPPWAVSPRPWRSGTRRRPRRRSPSRDRPTGPGLSTSQWPARGPLAADPHARRVPGPARRLGRPRPVGGRPGFASPRRHVVATTELTPGETGIRLFTGPTRSRPRHARRGWIRRRWPCRPSTASLWCCRTGRTPPPRTGRCSWSSAAPWCSGRPTPRCSGPPCPATSSGRGPRCVLDHGVGALVLPAAGPPGPPGARRRLRRADRVDPVRLLWPTSDEGYRETVTSRPSWRP